MMLFPKNKRIKDRKLLQEIRGQECAVKGCFRKGMPAHIRSVGAGGDDVPENLVPLCADHHIRQHAMGWKVFKEKHPEITNWAEIKKAGQIAVD